MDHTKHDRPSIYDEKDMTLLEKDRLGVLDLVGTVIQDVYSLKFYIVRTTGIFTYPNGTVALPKEAFNNSRFFPVGNIIAYSEDAERKSYFTPKQLKRHQAQEERGTCSVHAITDEDAATLV